MTSSSRTLQHVGEWKVELRADSLRELFAELARVVAQAIGPRRVSTSPGEWEHVALEARDHAGLLVDWANELIGRSEVAGCAYIDVPNLRIEPCYDPSAEHERDQPSPGGDTAIRLVAEVRGDPVDEWVSPLKAATHHGAVVERQGSAWRGVVLFDV